ncbi:alanine racemase [Microbacterium sp. NPDC057407]|uniref:alanine racemase n=1 Tax=Microbacterium sp. NPDC057407 TaxID=3346120 RepID=UPI00366BE5A1
MSALRVDLGVLATNIARVRERVAPARVMLVVKDDAYGHGLEPVVRRAHHEGVRWFGAFDVATASRVRAVTGGGARIFAWIAASRSELDAAIGDDVDLGVGDAELLEEVAEAAREAGATARVHLKIDSGLHRNGVRPEEWPAFAVRAAELVRSGCLDVVGLWSHIAEASDEEDDAARGIFERAVEQARSAGLTPELLHLSASAASFARAEFRYDLVRVGAFCYGIRPAGGPDERELQIQPVGRLEATVADLTDDRAVIDVGALDGLPSTLGGRVSLTVDGAPRRLLTVGPRSEVEAWPNAAVGDALTVYGAPDGPSATDFAEAIGTIGEEIAVRVSPLVERIYTGDPAPQH